MLDHRTAIVVRPCTPFLDWCRATDDENQLAQEVFENMQADPTLYLVDEFSDEQTLRENLAAFWVGIFEAALEGWTSLESEWPSPRTHQMFEEWFDIDVFESVVDLAE